MGCLTGMFLSSIRAGQLFHLMLYFPQPLYYTLACRPGIASESEMNLIPGVFGSILSNHLLVVENYLLWHALVISRQWVLACFRNFYALALNAILGTL